MDKMFNYIIVLILAGSNIANFKALAEETSIVEEAFVKLEVVPDVLSVPPSDLLEVSFPSGVEAMLGNELTPTQVKDEPTLRWDAGPDEYYTVAMTDPDAPSRAEPTLREYEHWLVGNVPACNVEKGEVLAEYVGTAPPAGTGLHRYVFLVYKQPGILTFDEPRLPNTANQGRPNFSIADFAIKYNLSDPIAGNIFQAEYDDYVPILNEQLGI